MQPQTSMPSVGRKYTNTDRKKDELQEAMDRLSWIDVRNAKQVPVQMSSLRGMALNDIIKALRLPKVSRVAFDEKYRTGLIAIEANYTNGRARVYVVDEGVTATAVRSDFWSIETLEQMKVAQGVSDIADVMVDVKPAA